MGYYNNLEVALATEEPDRLLPEPTGEVLTRLKPKRPMRKRRESYRAPKHWVLTNLDFYAVLALAPLAFMLGVSLTMLAVEING